MGLASRIVRTSSVLLVAVLGLYGCVSQLRGTAVSPGELFPGGYINIRAPQADGWQLLHSSGSGMLFGKQGETKTSSFVALVNMFDLAPASTPKDFEALIAEAAAKDTDLTRFDVQQQSLKYSTERSYPCVRYQALATDKSLGESTGPLLLELDGIYCRHPIRQDTGFAVVYSYRGPSRHPTLRSEAEVFVQGVQVPEK